MKATLFTRNMMTHSLIDLRTCADDSEIHCHEFFEIAYVLSGSCEHTVDGRISIISEGDYFLINLKQSHGYAAISRDFEILNCLFMPEFIDRTLMGAHSFSEIMNNYPAKFENSAFSNGASGKIFRDGDGFIRSMLMKMLDEFKGNKRGRLDVMRSLLVTLLITLAREGGEEEESPVMLMKKRAAENYTKEISLSEISQELGISLTYASLCFKRATDMNFRDYIMKLRIERSCDLLRNTDKTVSEISELVGYSDPAFFYRSFKKHLGMSPAEYRRSRSVSV